MRREYAITFAVEPLTDRIEDQLLETGRFSIEVRNGLTTVDGLWEGSTGVGAAMDMARALQARGVEVVRVVPDLVTMADIARRAEVSKQAVSKWANKAGLADCFPRPYTRTDSGQLWLWQNVNEWLRSNGHMNDPWEYLTHQDVTSVNEHLSSGSEGRPDDPIAALLAGRSERPRAILWRESSMERAAYSSAEFGKVTARGIFRYLEELTR